ncbi:MAG: response regulator [Spirochaetales bacterium]|nr:response regulator [Spirochaetales bacterium]
MAKTILVAEDERIIRNLAEITLKKAGYQVITANDGQEAVDIFKANAGSIDLLLMDIMMPNKNGWEAYMEIRKEDEGIPVVFCSGYSDDVLMEEYLHETPADIIQKPYHLNTLLEKIESVLSGSA